MALTPTAADRAALQAAIFSGTQSVKYADGREVRYQSIAEMRALLSEMDSALQATPTTRYARAGTKRQ